MDDCKIELSDTLKRLLRISENPEFVQRTFQAWLEIYQSYAAEQFDRNSAGGGDWEELKPATLAARRRRGNNDESILQDTGAIRENLDRIIGFSNSDAPVIGDSTRYIGFQDDGTPHPKWVNKNGRWTMAPGDLTIAELAELHQNGAGNLPQRPILIPPDPRLEMKMIQAVQNLIIQFIE